MSNRNYRASTVYSMEISLKQVFAKITFGAAGAPTLSAKDSKGMASVTRISAGLYELTMGTPASTQAATADTYVKPLMVRHCFISAGAPAAPAMHITSNTVATNGKLRVQFNAAGAPADPASGEVVLLQMLFCDSNT